MCSLSSVFSSCDATLCAVPAPLSRFVALCLTAALVLVAGRSAAQEEIPYVEAIEVRVANVDVVVTDSSGRRVFGLTRDDFELREDGQVRPITNFYEVTPEQIAAQHAGGMSSTMTPSAPPSPPVRKIVVLIDESSMELHRRHQLLDSLQTFLDKTLTPRDEVMLAVWRRGLHIAVPFTSDRARLRAAIASIRSDVSTESIVVAKAREDVERRVQTEVELVEMKVQTLDQAYSGATGHVRMYSDQIRTRTRDLARAIDGLMKILAGVEAKKSFVFVTGTFPTFPGQEYFAYIDATIGARMGHRKPVTLPESLAGNEGDLQTAIARTANANGITFYGISAAVDWDTTSVTSPYTKDRQKLPEVEFAAFTNTAGALQNMSSATGGVAMVGGTNFLGALAMVANDMNAYYSLGYRPTVAAGEHAKVAVRVKRPGLRVRSRTSTVGQTIDDEVSARVVGNLLYPDPRSDFAISAKAGAPEKEGRNLFAIPLEVRIPADAIVLLPGGERLKGGFSVFVGGRNVHGAISDVTQKRQNIDVPAAEAEAMKGKHWTFQMRVLVREDQNSVAVGVMDHIGRAVAFATVPIAPKG